MAAGRSAVSLAGFLYVTGEVQSGRDLEQDTLDRYRRIPGQDHPDTLRSAIDLAIYQRKLEEADG